MLNQKDYSPREDLLRLYRRQGYQRAPVGMHLCPALVAEFNRRHPEAQGDYLDISGPRTGSSTIRALPGTSTRCGEFRAATGSTGTSSIRRVSNTRCSSTVGAWRTSTTPIRTT